MIKIYPFENLGQANHGWLHARHHFSFGNYYNPNRMGFGALKVINDDIIKAGHGFPPHGHDNMEIITYVRQGAITHKDSQGNKGRTVAGDIQVMSAGAGITHSEYNDEKEDTNIFQIWITPNKRNITPSWDSYEFPKTPINDALPLLVSGDKNAPLTIQQDCFIYGGVINKNKTIRHLIHNQVYLLVSTGEITLEGKAIKKGDGAEITNIEFVNIEAKKDSEVLIIDVPSE